MSYVGRFANSHYVGRFAPSPTGPLHFGSLIAAVASYCEAKNHGGKWLLRMEDLDRPREMAGASDEILHTLEAFGFEWNGEILYQSQRNDAYAEVLNNLQNKQLVYRCTCTRKEIADSTSNFGIDGAIYPKNCLQNPIKANSPFAWRVETQDINIHFNDAIQGEITQNLCKVIGDFILKRADGLFAYQLAVVVDDAEQGITHVVRGADLLASTPRQIYLQQLLGLPTPNYAHVPVAVNQAGEKLSKQTLAAPIDATKTNQLYNALNFLGQAPPSHLQAATLADIWQWAHVNWNLSQVPRATKIKLHTN